MTNPFFKKIEMADEDNYVCDHCNEPWACNGICLENIVMSKDS